jgi:hypothetical protein
MVEVRFKKVESAAAIRKAFAEKSKSRQLTGNYERLFITNSVNLATRVRIDVMKAVAQKISSDRVKAFVVGFISRPVMHVRKLSDNSQRSYTFVDSIMTYGNHIRPSDLASAYKRAGSSFDGQLQQNFLVMTETEREECWSNSATTDRRPMFGSASRGARADRLRHPGRTPGVKRGPPLSGGPAGKFSKK